MFSEIWISMDCISNSHSNVNILSSYYRCKYTNSYLRPISCLCGICYILLSISVVIFFFKTFMKLTVKVTVINARDERKLYLGIYRSLPFVKNHCFCLMYKIMDHHNLPLHGATTNVYQKCKLSFYFHPFVSLFILKISVITKWYKRIIHLWMVEKKIKKLLLTNDTEEKWFFPYCMSQIKPLIHYFLSALQSHL